MRTVSAGFAAGNMPSVWNGKVIVAHWSPNETVEGDAFLNDTTLLRVVSWYVLAASGQLASSWGNDMPTVTSSRGDICKSSVCVGGNSSAAPTMVGSVAKKRGAPADEIAQLLASSHDVHAGFSGFEQVPVSGLQSPGA